MKGKYITLLIETIGKNGVITEQFLNAKVLYINGSNLTVRDEDGYIREVDRDNRNDDGDYVITIR